MVLARIVFDDNEIDFHSGVECSEECASTMWNAGAKMPNGTSGLRCRLDSFSGGAGIRTPVRDKIDHSVYVRVPLIEVSSRWPMDSPLLDKFPKFSPAAGKRDD